MIISQIGLVELINLQAGEMGQLVLQALRLDGFLL